MFLSVMPFAGLCGVKREIILELKIVYVVFYVFVTRVVTGARLEPCIALVTTASI